MQHWFIILISSLVIFAPTCAMEITKEDFDFKQKDYSLAWQTISTQGKDSFCDFSSKKDFNRTFANHELLWAETMKNQGIPEVVINLILKIRYHQIQTHKCNSEYFRPREYQDQFYKDIFWANKGQQKTYYYLSKYAKVSHLDNRDLVIEGVNFEFSQEIDKNIQSFPDSLKKVIQHHRSDSYYIKVRKDCLFNDICTIHVIGTIISVPSVLYTLTQISDSDINEKAEMDKEGLEIRYLFPKSDDQNK